MSRINQRASFYIVITIVFGLCVFGCTRGLDKDVIVRPIDKEQLRNSVSNDDDDVDVDEKVDDWQFQPAVVLEESNQTRMQTSTTGAVQSKSMAFSAASPDSIGFSVGGAKDINNFRENIQNKYLPLPTDITYEGLFYDYVFDTGIEEENLCNKLFCPSYTSAMSKDPFSGKQEYFLSVGLNSNIKQSDFARKKLNLVVVLDISGSMSSPFDRYYYDRFKQPGQSASKAEGQDSKEWNKTKMEVAKEAVVAMLKHLDPEDSFGMVLFDDIAYLAKPIRQVAMTDMEAIKGHIMELHPQGGTNMSAGMQLGKDLFKELIDVDSSEVENRIIFLTDAQPNKGELSETGMVGIAKDIADQKIYTSFIGIGVDFNTELIESITKIRGANYYSVHSPDEFKKRMDKNFDYMVTPLVFNLQLKLEAPGFEIQKVYGSPEANEATGEIMKVNTLFPSETTEEGTRGGLVLLHLKKIPGQNNVLNLKVSYEDRKGTADSDVLEFEFIEEEESYYANTGIHKGIVLARYASLIRNWLLHERINIKPPQELPEPIQPRPEVKPSGVTKVYYDIGIPVLPDREFKLGRWERQSDTLVVSPEYKELFSDFKVYFQREQEALGDEDMEKELAVLDILINF